LSDDRGSYDEKLQRILKASSAIFADKSYHQASVRDISAATGISLSGLYYYFRSKEELLFLIQSHCFETILERIRHDLAGVQDPEERLRILIRNHLTFFANNMAEMKVLSHEGHTLAGEYGQRVLEQKREYSEVVQSILTSLAPEGASVDPRVATFSLFGMMNWIYTWYRPDGDVGVEQLVHDMSHLFMRGYRSVRTDTSEAPRAVSASTEQTSIWRGPAT